MVPVWGLGLRVWGLSGLVQDGLRSSGETGVVAARRPHAAASDCPRITWQQVDNDL